MSETHPNTRLETFCDGVFAIALTLLVIDIRIPPTVEITNTADFWLALRHLGPAVFAFILSFIVILITWVNHHSIMKLVNKASPSFIYANGFLLLTVVFIPFPTALMGEYILTDHAAPSVMLYNFTLAIQAIAWILTGHTALKGQLTKNEKSTQTMRKNYSYGYFAFATYFVFAFLAFWMPLFMAALTTITWIFWLIYSITMKHE